MPIEYRSPFSAVGRDTVTPYLAVVGDGTAWPGAKKTKRSDIKGNSRTTILLIEAANSDIDWMEPRDMPFSQAILGVNCDNSSGICSFRDDKLAVLTTAGVDSLPVDISSELLEAALTINCEEETQGVDGDFIDRLKHRTGSGTRGSGVSFRQP